MWCCREIYETGMSTVNDSAVWQFRVKPFHISLLATCTALLVFVASTLINAFDEHALRTISELLIEFRWFSITYTIVVFIHSYAVLAYLICVSDYIGVQSREFMALCACCVIYLGCLVVVGYVPVSREEELHNFFAIMAFIFAILSSLLHKFGSSQHGEQSLAIYEACLIGALILAGALFWSLGDASAEYVLVGIILMEKHMKLELLDRYEILHSKRGWIVYSFNVETGQASPFQLLKQ